MTTDFIPRGPHQRGIHERAWVDHTVVSIERDVIIHPGAVVGATPFSYDRKQSPPKRKLSYEGVYLAAHVEIMSNAVIDCGLDRTTMLLEGVKVDHLAHVGHDAWIGRDSVICSQAFIGGFVHIGTRCYVGAGACIKPRVTLGDDVKVGMGAVVLEDVPDKAVVVGNPGRILKR